MRLLVLGGLISSQSIAADQIEILQLQHIVAEEIIPIVKPLLSSGTVVTGKGYQLIVRTTPSSLEKIRSIIRQIDVPKRMLRITLRQVDRSKAQDRGVSADGAIILSTDAKLDFNEDKIAKSDRIRLGTRKFTTQGRDDILYETITMENRATFLRLGKSVPYELQRFVTTGRHTGYGHRIGHKELSSGIFVVPRIQGEFVSLEISSQQQRLSSDDSGAVESSYVQSVVRGRQDEWITLGSTQMGWDVKDRKTTSRIIETRNDGFSVQLKVELLRQ